MLLNREKRVNIIVYIDNSSYLDTTTEKMYFCDYIDCSASHILVEGIGTNTPVNVNRHPVVVEYLYS